MKAAAVHRKTINAHNLCMLARLFFGAPNFPLYIYEKYTHTNNKTTLRMHNHFSFNCVSHRIWCDVCSVRVSIWTAVVVVVGFFLYMCGEKMWVKCGFSRTNRTHMRDAFYVMTAGALALFFGIVKARWCLLYNKYTRKRIFICGVHVCV